MNTIKTTTKLTNTENGTLVVILVDGQIPVEAIIEDKQVPYNGKLLNVTKRNKGIMILQVVTREMNAVELEKAEFGQYFD